ncbi:helix-turn-helix domain-containing protein [Chelatococcus asaccharovorans]|uniref:helix-turn-helix domain-containing protein n=1 Tax=Chelatococcus asaccharovorans TaxID=28210 RepID=UPI00224C648E|nr:AraC family transcriptional regulator [Chelatococcus asaccharovorans]CAH1668718.1 AraC-like protein [Chelatococcus asaccharovorans]CAH1679870.1 AraC-like protein [Chelatococcus asaccharovorans]
MATETLRSPATTFIQHEQAASAGWRYRLEAPRCEIGIWQGDRAPALGTHFHREDQLTLVLSGSRHFVSARAQFHVPSGHAILFPAGVPHSSLSQSHPDTRCLNAYITPSQPGYWPVVSQIQEKELADLDVMRLAARLQGQPGPADHSGASGAARQWRSAALSGAPVALLARQHGLGREAFSRKFERLVGMPPHAFRLVQRLNLARDRLRAGREIADVACECGFADQSHFGRHFRRAFGVTPRAYRDGLAPHPAAANASTALKQTRKLTGLDVTA